MQSKDESRSLYNNGHYQDMLEVGMKFQDHVARTLYKYGIVVVGYTSRLYQEKHGENMLGAEIKRDGKFRETGNLYIELAEKSHPDNASFVSSGISRKDNSWLYVIGDEKTLYIFSIKYLQKLSSRYRFVETPTSRGFLLPLAEAEKYCLRKLEDV